MQLRVAQVTLSMGQGGIENLILSLARAFSSHEVGFSLCCLDEGGGLLQQVRDAGCSVSVFRRRGRVDWRLILELARSFQARKIQVVHTHNQAAHFYGCTAARLAGVPVVVNTEHSRHYIDGHWRRRLEKKWLSLWSDRVVPVSPELSRLCSERDGISPEKLRVILNGVDLARFECVPAEEAAAFRAENNIPPRAALVVIVARLHPIKNHRLLLDAFREVVREMPEARLLVVGDGEERGALEQIARELQLADAVRFMGNRSDIPVILKACSALVLCSLSEGLPLVLLEGMAARVPVVVTQGANGAGLVRHQENGTVSAALPGALAAAVLKTLRAPEAALRLAETGCAMVQESFSIEHTAARYLELYHDCLSRHRRAS